MVASIPADDQEERGGTRRFLSTVSGMAPLGGGKKSIHPHVKSVARTRSRGRKFHLIQIRD